jgi:trans-aconitate 2-methyltransferase
MSDSHQDESLQPARDLLARVPSGNPGRVYDLGCGTGDTTRLLKTRWPRARITGVDPSSEALEQAMAGGGTQGRFPLEYLKGDIATWVPEDPADVFFSSGALHRVGDQRTLFLRLIRSLMQNGILAVAMPRLSPQLPTADFYRDLLAADARKLDVWETDAGARHIFIVAVR